MDKITPVDKQINDFIYDKPDVAVVLLQQFGYNINLKTATLSQIIKLVYTALYINQDKPFAEALDSAIANDGELNVIAIIASVISSAIGGVVAMSEGNKNRALQKKLVLAQLSVDEKLSEENIRAQQETARLKDTWLYVTGLGIGLGILYGVYLIGSKD